MKIILTLALLAVLAIAQDVKPLTITTLDGREYRQCAVSQVTPVGIRVTHEDGTATILFREMTEENKKQFGYNAEKAAAFEKQQLQAAKAAEEARRQALKEKVKRELYKTVLEVQTDHKGFLEKAIYLTGEIKVSSYYNYGYAKAQKTHFAFALSDRTGTAYLYMKRSKEAEVLRQKLLNAGTPVRVTCGIVLTDSEESSSIHAELVTVSAPEDQNK